MLFLLKRTVSGSLLGLIVLTSLGLSLRAVLPAPVPLDFSHETIQTGMKVFALILCSDAILHALFMMIFGERYLWRHRALGEVFRQQSYAALLLGALMAGVGEELVFRGLSGHPLYLGLSAILFGALHHIRRDLWPFTLWAMWQGLLFAATLYYTQHLGVTMVAHFLHDTTGFLLFRFLRPGAPPVNAGSV